MADDERIVRVDVGNDLLARFANPPPMSTDDYIDRLHSYRPWFEQIASAKYDEGEYAPEVNVLVVRITADDLL
ncbi:MAG TPA: hypothetical protein VGQ93_07605 [Lysobacter sp.]|jgi:hypothetical protein|nr:hypothetical protein [Lysobacter sp.]